MTIEWYKLIELASVAAVIIATVFIMQHHLMKAHHLLRLGLALVCAGSLMEFYTNMQEHDHNLELITGIVENVGQAAVYIWAATSKRLWRLLHVLNRRVEL